MRGFMFACAVSHPILSLILSPRPCHCTVTFLLSTLRDENNVDLKADELLIIRYRPIARFVEEASVFLL